MTKALEKPTIEECLKVANYFSIIEDEPEITLESFQSALAFFNISSEFEKIAQISVRFDDDERADSNLKCNG